MNLFLPYENNVGRSVQSLDDKRLIKQILEVYQLVQLCEKEKQGIDLGNRGYHKHPIYLHYKRYPRFLYFYGYTACLEYKFRFKKDHEYLAYFDENYHKYKTFKHKPFYMEGSKNDKMNCIRTLENVSLLYQRKLVFKWINSSPNSEPKWTNRKKPEFLRLVLDNKDNMLIKAPDDSKYQWDIIWDEDQKDFDVNVGENS